MRTNKVSKYLGAFIGIITIGTLIGCQNDDRLKEVSSVQAEAQLKSEKAFIDGRAKELEVDLTKRQAFFQGVAGTYEGTTQTPDGEYAIRIRLFATVPPYKPEGRVRTIDELTYDLNALHFKAQIVQWKVGSTLGFLGCQVDDIRPNLIDGSIQIASKDCPSFYEFHVNDGSPMQRSSTAGEGREMRVRVASDISRRLMTGQGSDVVALIGDIFPTSPTVYYPFVAKRRIEQ